MGAVNPVEFSVEHLVLTVIFVCVCVCVCFINTEGFDQASWAAVNAFQPLFCLKFACLLTKCFNISWCLLACMRVVSNTHKNEL